MVCGLFRLKTGRVEDRVKLHLMITMALTLQGLNCVRLDDICRRNVSPTHQLVGWPSSVSTFSSRRDRRCYCCGATLSVIAHISYYVMTDINVINRLGHVTRLTSPRRCRSLIAVKYGGQRP